MVQGKNRWLNFFKKWHRWPALVFSVFFLLWAVSGIILNHRKLFSDLDIGRKYLPEEYRYVNWNNAAVKSSTEIGRDSILLYGNIGAWLTNKDFTQFSDFNHGFPDGIDNRKIFAIIKTGRGNLYAGTLFGLYHYDWPGNSWQKLPLDIHPERITSLLEHEGRLMVLTRSEILECMDDPDDLRPERTVLLPPDGHDNRESLFRTFWVIHSGELYGIAGRLIIDALGIVLIILTITGLIHYIAPYILRRRKKRQLSTVSVSKTKRISIKWHKKLGIWIALLLLINVVTGMFLRPPLLITIGNSKVAKIPYSMLDSGNAWADKLRDLRFDPNLNGFLLSTSEGFYLTDKEFSSEPYPIPNQPPVSVMGINTFVNKGDGTYLIGSFSGLYAWNPLNLYAENYITGSQPGPLNTNSRPISDHMVSGYLRLQDGREYYFDYNLGATPVLHRSPFRDMPEIILENSPMSLWNLALEFHTARILKVIMGDFYILVIPLMGLFGTLILISGIVVWWKLILRKKIKPGNCQEDN